MSSLTTFSFVQSALIISLILLLSASFAMYLTLATMTRAADNLLASCLLLLVLVKLWAQWCCWIAKASAAQGPAPCLAIIRYQRSFIDWYLEVMDFLESPTITSKLRSIRFSRELVRKEMLVRIEEILRKAEEREEIARKAAHVATDAADALWKSRLEDAQQRYEELEYEKKEAQRELQSEREKKQELEAMCGRLEKKEEELKKENADLKGVQETLVSQCQTYNTQLAEKTQEAERHEGNANAFQQREVFLGQRNEQLRNINGDLQKKVAKLEKEKGVLEQTNGRQLEELGKLYNIFESLQHGIDATARPPKTRTPSPNNESEGSGRSPGSSETKSSEQPVLLHEPALWMHSLVTDKHREEVDEYLARGFESDSTPSLGSGANGAVREWRRPGGSGQVMAAKMLKLDEQTGGDASWMEQADLRENVQFAGRLMKREARFLMELKDTPHIVSCEMFRIHPNGYDMTLLLERMNGNANDLAAMGPGGRMDPRLGRTFLEQCSLGLTYLHQKKVVHLDIKGANIGYKMLAPGIYNFALLDFNTSVTESEATASWVGPAGTPGYMAPEVFRDTQQKGFKSDIFSLYVTMAELVGLGNDPAKYIRNLEGHKFLDRLHDGIRGGKETWDWADMAHEDPERRPSAQTIYRRAQLSIELQRWYGSPEYGGLWVEDRAVRNTAVMNMLRSQGWADERVAEFYKEHMALINSGDVTLS